MFSAAQQAVIAKLHGTPAGKWVQLARARNERDLANGHKRGLWFDMAAAQHVSDFYGWLKHGKGKWAGHRFLLEPWQQYDITWPLFGWKRADGTRRFRNGYIEVGKKNGKSTWLAGTGLYLTIADHEPGAEVYSVATKRDQARIIHAEAVSMLRKSPELSQFAFAVKNNISVPVTASKYEPLSADADTQDGINVHGALVDELHRWKSRDLLDILEQSTAARQQPLVLSITTAGSDRKGPCWSMREYACKILEGIFEDDSFFAYIATIDDDDDPWDETCWVKANPNLGVSIRMEELREQAEKAKASMAQQNAFLRFRMNRWTAQDVRWLDMHHWDKCGTVAIDRAALRGAECFAGLDLSTTLDITALVLTFPQENAPTRVLSFFFVPEDNIVERYRRDRVPYPDWARNGYIVTTPGNVVDYEFLRVFINELAKEFSICEIAYDPWNATQLAQQLQGDGLQMVQFRQGYASMNAPCKALEALVMSQRIEHGNHPVLRWMASNVAIGTDPAGNIKPDKARSTERIDGIVALVMALGRQILRGDGFSSVYAERELMIL